MLNLTRYLRRPGRWLRRTRWMAGEIVADLGLREPGGPAWLRDNPFLVKTSRAEMRRFSVGLRLLLAVLVLGVLLLSGLWLQRAHAAILNGILFFLLGTPFPTALFVFLTFAHMMLIANARNALTISLGDEARRGTLPDLLLTPLRRAEMLLAMAVGPARTALLVALAGLPIYVLLAEFGGLSVKEIIFLYVLFALISFAPPGYALPALSGAAPTPDTPQGKLLTTRARKPTTRSAISATLVSFLLGGLFLSQVLGLFGGGWLSHLLLALHVSMGRAGPLFLVFGWPYYLVQILGGPLNFFAWPLPPLFYVLPLLLLNWAAGALESAAALSAGDAKETGRLPLHSRARTLARWVARAAGVFALGVVWKAWVESGDTATLAGGTPGIGGADAAGLALLLGGLSLPNVWGRALAAGQGAKRSPGLALRRAFRRAARPLRVAGVTFLLACALGGLSPFAPAVYQMAGQIALAGLVSILWAVGLRRILPGPISTLFLSRILLYGLPVAALSVPLPALWNLAALSPASAWVRLFPEGARLLQRFPLWTVGTLPPFTVCVAGAGLMGLLLIGIGLRIAPPAPTTVDRGGARKKGGQAQRPAPTAFLAPPELGVGGRLRPLSTRNAPQTAALMAWLTARSDNPLFTYELRTRTRSGRWADWRFLAPGGFLAALLLAVTYPDFVNALSAFMPLIPFHFFDPGFGSARLASVGRAWASLAALLLAAQIYFVGFRGQGIGESLIARDRQRGTWGFILLTPLTMRQIFWGKVFGQASGFAAVWAVLGLCSLIFYALATPAVGVGPAFAAWLVGQFFVAALFLLGMGIGAAVATLPIFLKTLRGASTLLFVVLVGGGIYLNVHVFDFDQTQSWQLTAGRLLLGSLYCLGLAVPLFAFAEWRMAAVRKRDVPFGDGVE